MGILAYIGPLVVVSYATAKDDPFVMFHIKQGAVLFIIEIAMWFLSIILMPLWFIFTLVNLGAVALAILGIMNVVHGKQEDLPLVGKYAVHIKI